MGNELAAFGRIEAIIGAIIGTFFGIVCIISGIAMFDHSIAVAIIGILIGILIIVLCWVWVWFIFKNKTAAKVTGGFDLAETVFHIL